VTAELAREIFFRSGEHLVLVASSVALALLIALPLGLAIFGLLLTGLQQVPPGLKQAGRPWGSVAARCCAMWSCRWPCPA
jgi:hypothetical protein